MGESAVDGGFKWKIINAVLNRKNGGGGYPGRIFWGQLDVMGIFYGKYQPQGYHWQIIQSDQPGISSTTLGLVI